jgi:hypothetical protein
MASDLDRHRVVPKPGTTPRTGERVAPDNRAYVPAHSAGRRAPPGVSKDGQPLGAGGYAALLPHLGWPPTLPRPGDPGPAGNPVRAILGRLAEPSPDGPGTTVVRGLGGRSDRPLHDRDRVGPRHRRLLPCEICTGPSRKELHGVEDRDSAWKTPGQWPSMAESALMILHGFWADSPVVTDPGCCPSAARRSHPGPSGPQSESPTYIIPAT